MSGGVSIDDLVDAATNGFVDTAKKIIDAGGVDINGRGGCDYETPLFCAISGGHTEMVQLLLENHAKVNTDSRFTPLVEAISNYCDHGHDKIIRLLLESGADVQAPSGYGNSDSMTPLFAAIFLAHTDIVELLIEYGADIMNSKYRDWWVSHGHASIPGDNWTPLHAACARGHANMIEFLLTKEGIDLEARNANGWTPLHVACSYGGVDAVRVLLDHGADTQAETDMCESPLDIAGVDNRTDIIELLLSRSLDAQLYDSSRDGDVALVRELIGKGACVTWNHPFCEEGNTPLHVAYMNQEVLKILLDHCEDINHAKNDDGQTLLHLACEMEIEDTVDLVLEKRKGCKIVDVQDKNGCTPLHIACNQGNLTIVKVLVEKGSANVNAQDHEGNSPLHYICGSGLGEDEIAQYLLEQGAYANIRNKADQTPEDDGTYMGHESLVELLKKPEYAAGDVCSFNLGPLKQINN